MSEYTLLKDGSLLAASFIALFVNYLINMQNLPLRAMLTQKVLDLCKWGYEEYARKDALSLLIRYGWKHEEQRPFERVVRRMNGHAPEKFSRREKTFVIFNKRVSCIMC